MVEIYHYTQIKCLEGILGNKSNIQFHLTDSRLLNDPSEAKVLEKYVLNNCKAIGELLKPIYNDRFLLMCKKIEINKQPRWLNDLHFILSLTKVN